MAKTNRVQRQLIINITLMLFTLLTLVACVAAWFSTRTEANINNLNLKVSRGEIIIDKLVDDIYFPYAVKLFDTDADQFNSDVVQRTYTVMGEGQVFVEVYCNGKGMLAYVPADNVTDYYTALINDLKNQLRVNDAGLKNKSFDEIRNALTIINNKRIGTAKQDGNTALKIVYWVEYDQVKQELNSDDYWFDDSYDAHITVTG